MLNLAERISVFRICTELNANFAFLSICTTLRWKWKENIIVSTCKTEYFHVSLYEKQL